MGYIAFLLIYVVGGLTFLPTILSLIFLHAYFFFPRHSPCKPGSDQITDPIGDSADDGHNIKSEKAIANLPDQFQRSHEPDVAAGYFAVCREYVPGGINGKPPERTTPAGEVVAMESPSVYQSMYRSIFDRRQSPTLEPGKGNGKAIKRARNVFFVVLRHGHLMLYDDSEQLEVRHVISLEHHHIRIYGEEAIIPEGELWIKRNAICLARKINSDENSSRSKPFYLFSENCSEKEDFYFALLQNQDVKPHGHDNPPRPQLYDVKHAIGLVQKLHSSEEHLQTRWINALLGRAFLALYKTQEVEDFIRKKVSKKIARVKKPSFLSSIILQGIDMGESAPFITNPRLKDLTIDGECCVEADIKYTGNFRLEIAATARIELGTRFKAREVNLVLAVVVKALQGHLLVRFKPPPGNRIWMAFDKMPEMDMLIEPVVSSRQITYNIILRAIESRIREVIAETLVLPHWDDIPFTDTEHQEFRGGIWSRANNLSEATNQISVSSEEPEDVIDQDDRNIGVPASPKPQEDKPMSVGVPVESNSPDATSSKRIPSPEAFLEGTNRGHSTGAERAEKPPLAMRSRSFAAASNPLVKLDNVNVDSVKNTKSPQQNQDASSAMMALSTKSHSMSPTEMSFGKLQDPSALREKFKTVDSATASNPGGVLEQRTARVMTGNLKPLPNAFSRTRSNSLKVMNGTSGNFEEHMPQDADSMTSVERGQPIAALGAAAAAAAKKWGWSVLSRSNMSNEKMSINRAGTPEHPIGRGRPLPPPGQPLPFPDRPSSKVLHGSTAKRRPLRSSANPQGSQNETKAVAVPKTPPSMSQTLLSEPPSSVDDGSLMIVEAPHDSAPESPIAGPSSESFNGNAADSDDNKVSRPEHQGDTASTQIRASTELSSSHGSSSSEENNGASISYRSACVP